MKRALIRRTACVEVLFEIVYDIDRQYVIGQRPEICERKVVSVCKSVGP